MKLHFLKMHFSTLIVYVTSFMMTLGVADSNSIFANVPECHLELSSLLKSGSTWTEIVMQELSKAACSHDDKCLLREIHHKGKKSKNRTIGFRMYTPNDVPFQNKKCNHSLSFDSRGKHNFWGTSFYRIGLKPHRSFFQLIMNNCIHYNLTADSRECYNVMVDHALDAHRLKLVETAWRNVACIRDPRAVAVSECHWMGWGRRPNEKKCQEISYKFEELVHGTAFLYNYWTTVPLHSHIVFYEKMLERPHLEYRKLARYMGIGRMITDEDISIIVQNTTVAALAGKEF